MVKKNILSHRVRLGEREEKMEKIRMTYRKYKAAYADCKTVPGTYDKGAKTIVVIVPEGRMKKSGTRGQKYNYYRFSGINKLTGEKAETIVKAITGQNAIKQLLQNYNKDIEWNLNF